MDKPDVVAPKQLKIADLFCGIGSMTMVGEELGMQCVFACDNDLHVKKTYYAQYGVAPDGDIREISPETVPDHDILCAGFPCQPFSRMGNKRGSNEERGRVMDFAIDILRVKRPRCFILENVRGLLSSNAGEDFKRLESMVKDAGYSFQHQLLKCEDFGIPQTRHRVFMVGFRDGYPGGFRFPTSTGKCPTLGEFLGMDIVKPMSNTIRCSGRKSGVDNSKNWSAYRLRDGTIFEYTIEHALKMQGFPADFKWGDVPDSQKWKMLGNTIPTCLSKAILQSVGKHLSAFPEKPAKLLPLIEHPPPVRSIIEKRLLKCEKEQMERRQMAGRSPEEEEDDVDAVISEGGDDEDAEDLPTERPTAARGVQSVSPQAPKLQKKRDHPPDDEEEIVSKKPKISPTATAPPAKIAAATMLLTIKSGTSITLTIPDGVSEQQCVLKIIK